MKYSISAFLMAMMLLACSEQSEKNSLVIYPNYCGGCISRNFSALHNYNLHDKFNVYFDTTNAFVLNEAKLNKIQYIHMSNEEIPAKFGDYSNLVVVSIDGKTTELTTNETLKEGVQF